MVRTAPKDAKLAPIPSPLPLTPPSRRASLGVCRLTRHPAENYYTADYPDDEVDSGDEYDRDPYTYRTGNASDLEEYGEADDDNYSIDDDKDERDEFSKIFGANRRPRV